MSSGYQPFLIANTRVGLQRDMEPWLIPQDAYPNLEDCYLWRGRIKRRLGYNLLGRLKRDTQSITPVTGEVTLSTQANGASYAVADILADASMVIFAGSSATIRTTAGNAQIAAGSVRITVGAVTFTDQFTLDGTLTGTPGTNSGTINYITGALSLSFSPALGGATNVVVVLSYFPDLPVMGLRSLDIPLVQTTALIGFDTIFSYLFNNTNDEFEDKSIYKTSASGFTWHGTTVDLFWTTNYLNAMFTTNNVPGIDGRRYDTLTAGATTTIVFTGVDVTSLFQVNDYVYINPDVTTTFATFKQGSGQVTSSVFAVDTTIVINVTSTGNSTTGTLLNVTRQIGNGTTIGDGIKWFDQDESGWVNFQPQITGDGSTAIYLQGSLLILAYKNRLVMLNTQEGSLTGTVTNYAQRARWSQNGTVYYAQPVPTGFTGGAQAVSWRSDIVGRGGYIDAPTLESIVSAYFVKDTLIVYFQKSVWKLTYTGNELLPFIWEKINTELGADSTFSIVPFDEYTIAFGNVGIHSCDSVNVRRIDQIIPDVPFEIQNANQGEQRVFGVRDYFNQLVYWSMPYNENLGSSDLQFPNTILVYNYVDKSYSFFNDCFTCFGYFQSFADLEWEDADFSWETAAFQWNSPQEQSAFPFVVGGNQQGFVEKVMLADTYDNSESLYISDISISGNQVTITSPNHNLVSQQFIKIIICSGISNFVGNIYEIISYTTNTILVNIPSGAPIPSGTFTGNGLLALVSNINITTKRFNPFIGEAAQTRLGYVDFYFDTTENGQVTVNLFTDENSDTPVNTTYNTINTFPETTYQISPDTGLINSKIWKRIYFQNIGQLFQFQVTMSPDQMMDENISFSEIAIHGMLIWVSKSGRLINV